MSFPKAAATTLNLWFSLCLFKSSNVSLKVTIWLFSFGISIPIVLLPGIGACILTSLLARASEISLFKPSILDTLVPCCNCNSYWTTEGPILTSTTLPIIPKSLNVCVNFLELEDMFCSSSALFTCLDLFGISSKSKLGNT